MGFDNAVVAAVSAQCGLEENVVRSVLTALEQTFDGAPVGTVLQDPATGSVAVRVAENGVLLWKVAAVDGGEWKDMQPNLKGWTVLVEPK